MRGSGPRRLPGAGLARGLDPRLIAGWARRSRPPGPRPPQIRRALQPLARASPTGGGAPSATGGGTAGRALRPPPLTPGSARHVARIAGGGHIKPSPTAAAARAVDAPRHPAARATSIPARVSARRPSAHLPPGPRQQPSRRGRGGVSGRPSAPAAPARPAPRRAGRSRVGRPMVSQAGSGRVRARPIGGGGAPVVVSGGRGPGLRRLAAAGGRPRRRGPRRSSGSLRASSGSPPSSSPAPRRTHSGGVRGVQPTARSVLRARQARPRRVPHGQAASAWLGGRPPRGRPSLPVSSSTPKRASPGGRDRPSGPTKTASSSASPSGGVRLRPAPGTRPRGRLARLARRVVGDERRVRVAADSRTRAMLDGAGIRGAARGATVYLRSPRVASAQERRVAAHEFAHAAVASQPRRRPGRPAPVGATARPAATNGTHARFGPGRTGSHATGWHRYAGPLSAPTERAARVIEQALVPAGAGASGPAGGTSVRTRQVAASPGGAGSQLQEAIIATVDARLASRHPAGTGGQTGGTPPTAGAGPGPVGGPGRAREPAAPAGRAEGPAVPPGGAGQTTATGAAFDDLVRRLEDHLLVELERRGGRYRGVF